MDNFSLLTNWQPYQRLTGTSLDVTSGPDHDRGIVLTLRNLAPGKIRNDPAVIEALKNDGSDNYNDREAFFLRSEPDRLLIVANTVDGLLAAVPALFETVDYEVLAMGPNWIHVPQKTDRLVFQVELGDRPDFYLRRLSPTSGQGYGVGTIQTNAKFQLSDSADESVSDSYRRWAIAIRQPGKFHGCVSRARHVSASSGLARGDEKDRLKGRISHGRKSSRPRKGSPPCRRGESLPPLDKYRFERFPPF